MTASMQSRRSLRAGSAGFVVLAALCTSGAFSPVSLLDDGMDVPPGVMAAKMAMNPALTGAPYSFALTGLCLTRPGSVTVTGVEPVDPVGGLTVSAFATAPSAFHDGAGLAFGTAQGSLHDLSHGIGTDRQSVELARDLDPAGPQTVEGRCDVEGTSEQFVVEVVKPTDATASMQGVAIGYTVPGEWGTRHVVIPMGLTLCAAGDLSTPDCSRGSHPES